MASHTTSGDDLRPEYEESVFNNATRGKYSGAFKAGVNVVRLAPDVAAAFPTEEAVNDALRLMQRIAQDVDRLTKRGS